VKTIYFFFSTTFGRGVIPREQGLEVIGMTYNNILGTKPGSKEHSLFIFD
jgi:hypothetical protein